MGAGMGDSRKDGREYWGEVDVTDLELPVLRWQDPKGKRP